MNRINELENLLDLDGETFQMGRGYWTKFEVKRVVESAEIPHGIRYSLTLHERSGTRLLGFDNAHGLKGKKFRARRVEWDHRHDEERISAYTFNSPGELLEDFWKAVNELIATK